MLSGGGALLFEEDAGEEKHQKGKGSTS